MLFFIIYRQGRDHKASPLPYINADYLSLLGGSFIAIAIMAIVPILTITITAILSITAITIVVTIFALGHIYAIKHKAHILQFLLFI